MTDSHLRPPPPEAVRWPEPPQDTVIQDSPVGAAAPPAVPSRWSGRRTAAVGALALALTSAGALAAAAATPSGIAGPTQQRGAPGAGPAGQGGPGGFGGRQLGPGQQQGPATPGVPGQPVPGQGRGTR